MSESELYPGLDAELEAVYERNVAEGRAKPAEEVAVSGLETAVEEQLQQRPERELAIETYEWANPQLKEALQSWVKYDALRAYMPGSTELLAVKNPNFAITMQRLYEAQQAFWASNEVTPENINIGETMHLVLMPWQFWKDKLEGGPDQFEVVLESMREAQGIKEKDYFNENLLKALKNDHPLYRDPNDTTGFLTPGEYLEGKIAKDGPWGIMLVQNSNQAGVKDLIGKSPDQLLDVPSGHLQVESQPADAMGILEWLSLTLQEDPQRLSSEDYSWMLANRMEVDGGPRVPSGDWGGDQVGSFLFWADSQFDYVRPRLAVS